MLTRAELNTHFKATNNLKRADELSSVIRSFLRFQRIAKKMDLGTNTVTFWIPDKAHQGLQADIIDPARYEEDDFLGIALRVAMPTVKGVKAEVVEEPKEVEKEAASEEEVKIDLEEALSTLPKSRLRSLTVVRTKGGWPKKEYVMSDNGLNILNMFETGVWLSASMVSLSLSDKHQTNLAMNVVQRLLNSLEKRQKLQRGTDEHNLPVYWKFGDDAPGPKFKALDPDEKIPKKVKRVEEAIPFTPRKPPESESITIPAETLQKYTISAASMHRKPRAYMGDDGIVAISREDGSEIYLTTSESAVLLRLARRLDLIQLEVEDNAIRRQ